jgi:hypothetical protein
MAGKVNATTARRTRVSITWIAELLDSLSLHHARAVTQFANRFSYDYFTTIAITSGTRPVEDVATAVTGSALKLLRNDNNACALAPVAFNHS